MSIAALERIERCQAALIEALESGDVRAIETAVAALRTAVEEAPDDWSRTPETKAAAQRAVAGAEDARTRVNFLTDVVRRRLERLSIARGHGPCATYGAAGR